MFLGYCCSTSCSARGGRRRCSTLSRRLNPVKIELHSFYCEPSLQSLLSSTGEIEIDAFSCSLCTELMTLGFISLLLTVTGRYISRICIPEVAANTMLPCRQSGHSETKEPKGHGRRHLSEDPSNLFSCPKVSD